MRTRLIRPEFFEDELMAGLSVDTRFLYIGLWTLCDDAGYFDQSVRRIAGSLFRYEEVGPREMRVSTALDALVAAGRVELLSCQVHGIVPTLPRWKMKGGNQSSTLKTRHDNDCKDRPVRTGLYKYPSVSVSCSETESGDDSPLGKAALAEGGFVARLQAGDTAVGYEAPSKGIANRGDDGMSGVRMPAGRSRREPSLPERSVARPTTVATNPAAREAHSD